MFTAPLPQALKILTAPLSTRSSMRTGLCLWKGRAFADSPITAVPLASGEKAISKAAREDKSKCSRIGIE
jgi:hypothetical protein